MIKSYVICATPRSGSNLLCEMLSSFGFAGTPGEHLWDPPGAEPEPLASRWPRVLKTGASENGVFGVKLMWYQADRLERELPEVLGMPGRSLADVLDVVLAAPRYIYVTRGDHVRQAISLLRAVQTQRWRSMDADIGRSHYDADAITQQRRFLAQDEANWEHFFARSGTSPYRLTYEDLERHPEQTLTSLLAFLGHRASEPLSLTMPQLQRQADGVTEEWLRHYRQDIALERE